ncbi:MAG TPA: hypothetical protein VN900_01395 [Stellaceae bacterium]|jgi:hypothetical protein|nr:hypothetical protein [Stellaceae bacterium]
MDGILRCAMWGLAGLAFLLSPAIVVFGAPFAIGIASDIVETAGSGAVALVLAAIAGIVAWRRLLPAYGRWALRRRPPYAAKSIT